MACPHEAFGEPDALFLILIRPVAQGRQGAQHAQHAAASGLRLELHVGAASRHQGADPVAAAHGGPGDQRGGFRSHDRFVRGARAEEHARAEIHDQDYRALAFFLKELGVGAAGARCHAPVDAAHVVAGLVDARLGELHAAAAEARAVSPDKASACAPCDTELEALGAEAQPDEVVDADIDAAQSGPRSAAAGHGTGTSLSSSSVTASESMPSASASKEMSTRWRSTSRAMACTSCGDT